MSPGQRDTAARLVEDRIEALARQVTVLRRLHDSVRTPDAVTSVPAILGATVAAVSPDPQAEMAG